MEGKEGFLCTVDAILTATEDMAVTEKAHTAVPHSF